MKYHQIVLLCFGFVFIFCTQTSSADSKVTIQTKQDSDPNTVHFSVKKSIVLKCNTSEKAEITWEKGGTPVKDVKDLKDRISDTTTNESSELMIQDAKESDAGNYTCVALINGVKQVDSVALVVFSTAKWGVKVPKNTNVVEGEKLTIKCQVRGDLTLEWWYFNTTLENANWTKLPNKEERERVTIRDYYDEERKVNVTNGELKVLEVTMDDRGNYMCVGMTEDGVKFNMTSGVRVKDKYAALWPFLGICAEVFVLCAIIFIYEKKRNKTELEESDTDQSPDQKNTPDHGKESNLRHRQ